MSDKNPEDLKDINSLDITSEIKDFVTKHAQRVTEEKGKRGEWENRIRDWSDKRYGIRNKKVFPWEGAANFVMPLIDADIARLKPSYVNLAFGVSPIVAFEPFGSEDIEPARKREYLFDWRMRNEVDFFRPYCIGVDKALEKGFVIFKITWNFKTRTYTEFLDIKELDVEIQQLLYDASVTDQHLKQIIVEEFQPDMSFEENDAEIDKAIKSFRNGKTKLEMEFTEKEHDEPQVTVCDPADIVIPVDTTDINQASLIDFPFFMSKNDLKIAMQDGKYKEYTDAEMDSWLNKYPERYKNNIATRDGVSAYTDLKDVVYLHEACVWYDIDGDGIEERCICTYPDANPSQVLRFIELPYDHGMWPYVQVRREFNDDLFYSSRGIPALDDDFQVGISTKFNQDIDNQTIVNTPTVVYKRNSIFNKRNLRYIPGQAVEVNDPTDYEIRQQPNLSQATFLTSAQYLKTWANERVGNLTSGLSEASNLPGQAQGGKKTAAEVNAVTQYSNMVQSLDLQVWQNQMSKVYYQIDALYDQFGDEEIEFEMTGEKKQKISRREIQGKFNIVPNGRVDNSNPQLRAARSFSLLRAFLGDPDIKQYELKKMYLDDVDLRISKKLLYSPEELQQRQMMLQQQAQQAQVQMIQNTVGMKQLSNTLDLQKEVGLAAIQGRKYAPDPEPSTK